MDVDTTKTTTRPPPICYSCGKKGHIARNCKGKETVRSINVTEFFETMTEEEKSEMKKNLDFVENLCSEGQSCFRDTCKIYLQANSAF